MSLAARLFAGLLLPLLVFFHHFLFPDPSLIRAREQAGWLDQRTESFWQGFASRALAHALKERDFAKSELLLAADPLTERREIEPDAEAKQAALRNAASYNKIPEVIADQGVPALFPLPLDAPTRFSSFRAAADTARALALIRRIKKATRLWKELRVGNRTPQLLAILGILETVDATLIQAAQGLRISQTWVPRHLVALQDAKGPTGMPRSYRALDALIGKGSATTQVASAREELRPKREVFHSFLPMSFRSHRGQTIRLKVVTDIASRRFREEFEGAVDTYWNQSSWARGLGIRFSFEWQTLPVNTHFLKNEEDLESHLARFPKKRMILTSGAQNTQVMGSAMILGPGKITPRTLAHEFGHILGFPDCYMRTISGEGFFGIGVLEWSNPFFPDELMCDNHLGIVHAVRAD